MPTPCRSQGQTDCQRHYTAFEQLLLTEQQGPIAQRQPSVYASLTAALLEAEANGPHSSLSQHHLSHNTLILSHPRAS